MHLHEAASEVQERERRSIYSHSRPDPMAGESRVEGSHGSNCRISGISHAIGLLFGIILADPVRAVLLRWPDYHMLVKAYAHTTATGISRERQSLHRGPSGLNKNKKKNGNGSRETSRGLQGKGQACACGSCWSANGYASLG